MNEPMRFMVLATLVGGCSGSSETSYADEVDAKTDAGAVTVDAANSAPDVSAPDPSEAGANDDAPSAPSDATSALVVPDGPLGACVSCVIDKCSTQAMTCLNNAACRAGLVCTLATCLPTGASALDASLDLTCALACFKNDVATALTAVSNLTCVTSNCTDTCASLIPADN